MNFPEQKNLNYQIYNQNYDYNKLYISEKWNLNSKLSIIIVITSLTLLNITPLLSSIGSGLAAIAAFASVFNPYAAFLYVAASQIAPNPPGLPLTLAQLFVVAWAVLLPFNSFLKNPFRAIGRGLKYMLPFMLFYICIGLANRTLQMDWVYAFITAAILCTYLPYVQGRYVRLLWMLALGALLGVLGHWGTAIGLPMEGIVYDQLVRGGARMGSGRADVNFASVNVGFAMWTIVALLLPSLWLKNSRKRARTTLLVGITFLACAIPLLSMGSRGGLGYLVLGGLATGFYALQVGALRGKMLATAISISAALLVLSPLLWPMFLETQPGQMLLATLEYNLEQSGSVRAIGVAAGRTEIWSKFFAIAAEYPIFGAPQGAIVDMGEYGFAVIGGGGAEGKTFGGTGHNVLLDIAAGRGFPTAILFAVGFCWPVAVLARRMGMLYALPFIIAHVMVFLPFMNLSIANWKTYWALHIITATAAAVGISSPKPSTFRKVQTQ
jgi:O-antigen ligase